MNKITKCPIDAHCHHHCFKQSKQKQGKLTKAKITEIVQRKKDTAKTIKRTGETKKSKKPKRNPEFIGNSIQSLDLFFDGNANEYL